MDKEVIKRILVENQEFVKNVKLIKRPFKFERNGNYVLLGIRRAGKSFLMYQRIHELLAEGHSVEEICYINFEDDRLLGYTAADLDLIKQSFEELFHNTPIFFLDEVQIVPGWEKFARRLADKGYRVYITGSNAKMLSSEIETVLGGRFLTLTVYPYSFKEYLCSINVGLDANTIYSPSATSAIVRSFDEYFYYGGFPEIGEFENKRLWLGSLYQKILLGDIVARYSVRNPDSMRLLVKKLAESVMQPVSYNRLQHVISSSGEKVSVGTIIDYLNYLKESWLIFSMENFASHFSERETGKKYYFIDNGIINLMLFNPEAVLTENLVAATLYREYGKDVYFYNKNVEADFYIPEKNWLIQASYSMTESATSEREIKALTKGAEHLGADKLEIVTKNEERIIEHGNRSISVTPLWKWLLQMSF